MVRQEVEKEHIVVDTEVGIELGFGIGIGLLVGTGWVGIGIVRVGVVRNLYGSVGLRIQRVLLCLC